MGSTSEVVTVVPIHRRPDLLEACADLINEEWKRSQASRIHSLQKSCDDFPVCLVLIKNQRVAQDPDDELKIQSQVVGHARLARVLCQPKSLFVESVVISKQCRGKGLGRKLMEATECYAHSRGFRQLHLTTHDKQHFYAHLGYALSEPVQNVGSMSSFVSMEFLETLSRPHTTKAHEHEPIPAISASCSAPDGSSTASCQSTSQAVSLDTLSCPLLQSSASTVSNVCSAMLAPLPPPPSLPPNDSNVSFNSPPPAAPPLSSLASAVSYGCLRVSMPSQPPPPPPPLPPLLSPFSPVDCSVSHAGPHTPDYATVTLSLSSHVPPGNELCSTNQVQEKQIRQTLLETPYRDLRGLPIFWMKKNI